MAIESLPTPAPRTSPDHVETHFAATALVRDIVIACLTA